MKTDKSVFDLIVKVCSILVLSLGVLLVIYIFAGPSLGLIDFEDFESASFGILLAAPVIIAGIIAVVQSFRGHTKASAVIMILLVLIFVFNIWNGHRIDNADRQHMIDLQSQRNQQPRPMPQIPNP